MTKLGAICIAIVALELLIVLGVGAALVWNFLITCPRKS